MCWVTEQNGGKIQIGVHKTRFESPVSSSRSKIHDAARDWLSHEIRQAGAS